jgi:hypothetical protein
MKEPRSLSSEWSSTGRFDDEITLPLRIICERKPDSGGQSREQLPRNDAPGRNPKETHKPVRAA